MESEIEEILRIYAEACEEEVARIGECLLELERNPEETELLHEAFRLTHTIKGDSRTVGFDAPNQIAHLIEDAFDRLRSGTWSVNPELISGLLKSVDLLGQIIRAALDGDEPRDAELDDLVENARRQLGLVESRDPEQNVEASCVESSDSGELPRENSETPRVAENQDFAGRRSGSLRIRIEVLDRMLDLTGELAIARSRITRLISDIDHFSLGALREAHRDVDLLFDEMQEEVMRARMVPIGPVFRQHKRTVRDLALSDGKRARMEIRGAEAELDTTVIEHVRDCLGHVIRNAIAHGIESPDERIAAGKDPYGCIQLAARHEGGNIVVEVKDDGAGLDLDRVLARARELGMLGPDDTPSEEDIGQFIYSAGFSTRDGASLTSGRGVGMDVVRNGIEALGGSVRVESQRGEGCTVSLRLPLTLAIIDGFEVAAGSETFVIPLTSIVECIDLQGTDHDRRDTSEIISLRGKPLPYARLRNLLDIKGALPARESIVVVRDGGIEAGVVVDSLLGESQVVIKPLGKLFRGLPGVAGSTILADGDVALILDVPALLRTALQRGHEAGVSASSAVLAS